MHIHEGDSSEENDEATQKEMDALPVKSSENSAEGIEEDSKTPQDFICVKDVWDVEMVGAPSVIQQYQISHNMFPGNLQPTMLFTLNEQSAGSKTICAKNLSYSVECADLEDLFKECGEIVDIRLHTDSEGRFKGFGHVEFASAEAAQKQMILKQLKAFHR
ncbi:hypothetical protein V8G54_001234 [Vigna mungo]|uniref:RRM domain-containing protein n=1 Tax=Vigna mungo TaxID=3915 RepID=A0AAQ3P7V9_VIGMU